MEPYPIAFGGLIAGWFARGFSGLDPSVSSAPLTCSCSCDCPLRGEAIGWSGTSVCFLVVLSVLAAFVGGTSFVISIQRLAGQKKDPVVISPVKGKKGLGVVGKTLELTQ